MAVGLIALEPDMGTAALVMAVLCSMLFAAGIRLWQALPALLVAVPLAATLAWSRLAYLQDRIRTFLEGDADPLGSGYHVRQALIAQGSGGVFGTGLGQGYSKLLFLPESHNDFIFAVIGEELGLVGSIFVLTCFALFVWQGWRIVRHAPDLLGSLIAFGITLLVGIQAAIHMAVVTRSMPAKGICLPIVSYGGSALVFSLLGVGLLLNIAAHGREGECKVAGHR
jgi:cell division protein FtsW